MWRSPREGTGSRRQKNYLIGLITWTGDVPSAREKPSKREDDV